MRTRPICIFVYCLFVVFVGTSDTVAARFSEDASTPTPILDLLKVKPGPDEDEFAKMKPVYMQCHALLEAKYKFYIKEGILARSELLVQNASRDSNRFRNNLYQLWVRERAHYTVVEAGEKKREALVKQYLLMLEENMAKSGQILLGHGIADDFKYCNVVIKALDKARTLVEQHKNP